MDSPYILASPAESPVTTDADEGGVDEPPSPPSTMDQSAELQAHNEFLSAEVLFHRVSFQCMESVYKEAEESLVSFQEQRDEAMARSEMVEELLIERERLQGQVYGWRRREEELARKSERGSLEKEIYEGMREREELVRKIDSGAREREGLVKEIGDFRVKIGEWEEERRERDQQILKSLQSLSSIKESLIGLCEGLDEEKVRIENAGSDLSFEMPEAR